MLVSWALRNKLAALEAAGKIKGEVVIVPVANPIGLNQHFLGHHTGRFEDQYRAEFQPQLRTIWSALVQPVIEARLTDNIDQNRKAIRTAMREALDAIKPGNGTGMPTPRAAKTLV